MLAAAYMSLAALALMAVPALIAARMARDLDPFLGDFTRPRLRRMGGDPPSLPIGFRYDAVMPGPLQLVDDDRPTTKVCPDCAETVLASARVCKHCRYRFEPPLSGSASA